MGTTSPSAFPEASRLHAGTATLAMVIASNLASAHSTGQYLTGLAALALALAHDILTHRHLRLDKRPGKRVSPPPRAAWRAGCAGGGLHRMFGVTVVGGS